MVRSSVWKLVKTVATGFVAIEICISWANPQWWFRQISKQDYLSEELGRTRTGRSEQGFESVVDMGDRERVASLDPFSLVAVGIFKRPFTTQTTVIVELEEALFERGMRCDC